MNSVFNSITVQKIKIIVFKHNGVILGMFLVRWSD